MSDDTLADKYERTYQRGRRDGILAERERIAAMLRQEATWARSTGIASIYRYLLALADRIASSQENEEP